MKREESFNGWKEVPVELETEKKKKKKREDGGREGEELVDVDGLKTLSSSHRIVDALAFLFLVVKLSFVWFSPSPRPCFTSPRSFCIRDYEIE